MIANAAAAKSRATIIQDRHCYLEAFTLFSEQICRWNHDVVKLHGGSTGGTDAHLVLFRTVTHAVE